MDLNSEEKISRRMLNKWKTYIEQNQKICLSEELKI